MDFGNGEEVDVDDSVDVEATEEEEGEEVVVVDTGGGLGVVVVVVVVLLAIKRTSDMLEVRASGAAVEVILSFLLADSVLFNKLTFSTTDDPSDLGSTELLLTTKSSGIRLLVTEEPIVESEPCWPFCIFLLIATILRCCGLNLRNLFRSNDGTFDTEKSITSSSLNLLVGRDDESMMDKRRGDVVTKFFDSFCLDVAIFCPKIEYGNRSLSSDVGKLSLPNVLCFVNVGSMRLCRPSVVVRTNFV